MPPDSKGQVEVELRRDLGLFDITMIGVGAMIGAGIFVLTGTAAGVAGPAAILAFIFNGLVTTLTAFTYAELGSCFPEAGGGYLWVKQSIPHPAGFLSGWMSWMAHTVACALYALGFGSYMAWWLQEYNVSIFGLDQGITAKIMAVSVGLILLSINYIGTGATGKSENFFTMAKIVILGIFIGAGIYQMATRPGATGAFFDDFMPNGMSGVVYAMGITFIAFEGYEIIAQCGEEVENPKKNIPKAIFISLAVVIIMYILVMIVAVGAVKDPAGGPSWQYLGDQGEVAMVTASENFMPWSGVGFIIMIVGGLLSTMSALNATIFSSSRVSFAMGRDGSLPKAFGKIHPVRRTPSVAIWATGVIMLVMVVSIPIEDVAASADVLFLALFAMANTALIILRYKRPDLDRGFKVPLFPWIPAIAIGSNIFLIAFLVSNWHLSGWIALAWIEMGLLVYLFTKGEEDITSIEKVEKYIGAKKRVTGKDYHVLVPISNPESTSLLDLSTILADRKDGDVVMLNIAKVPKNLPIRNVEPAFVQKRIATAEQIKSYADGRDVATRAKVVVSHTINETILAEAEIEKANIVVLGWMGPKRTRKWLFGYNLDPVIQHARCDVTVLKCGDFQRLEKILVVAGWEVNDTHAARATRTAALIAQRYKKPVSILIIRKSGLPSDAESRSILDRMRGICSKRGVESESVLISTSKPVRTIMEKLNDNDLLVMGASNKWRYYRYAFGPMQDTLSKRARCSLLYYRAGPKEGEGTNGPDDVKRGKDGPKKDRGGPKDNGAGRKEGTGGVGKGDGSGGTGKRSGRGDGSRRGGPPRREDASDIPPSELDKGDGKDVHWRFDASVGLEPYNTHDGTQMIPNVDEDDVSWHCFDTPEQKKDGCGTFEIRLEFVGSGIPTFSFGERGATEWRGDR